MILSSIEWPRGDFFLFCQYDRYFLWVFHMTFTWTFFLWWLQYILGRSIKVKYIFFSFSVLYSSMYTIVFTGTITGLKFKRRTCIYIYINQRVRSFHLFFRWQVILHVHRIKKPKNDCWNGVNIRREITKWVREWCRWLKWLGIFLASENTKFDKWFRWWFGILCNYSSLFSWRIRFSCIE